MDKVEKLYAYKGYNQLIMQMCGVDLNQPLLSKSDIENNIDLLLETAGDDLDCLSCIGEWIFMFKARISRKVKKILIEKATLKEFLSENNELVSISHIMATYKKGNHISYRRFIFSAKTFGAEEELRAAIGKKNINVRPIPKAILEEHLDRLLDFGTGVNFIIVLTTMMIKSGAYMSEVNYKSAIKKLKEKLKEKKYCETFCEFESIVDNYYLSQIMF